MTQFIMDKQAIKKMADTFKQTLVNWKTTLWRTVPVYLTPPSSWTEEEAKEIQLGQIELIDHILLAYEPIYQLAISEDIDEPFDLTGYMGGRVGRVLWDELSYPEITKPLNKLTELLHGGLTCDEFWATDYYRKHLLPKKLQNPKSQSH